MQMQRQARDQRLGHECAGKCHAADEERDRDHLRRHDAGQAENGEFRHADADGNDRVGGDNRGTFETRRHQQREQNDPCAYGTAGERSPAERGKRKAARRQRNPRRRIIRRKGTLAISMRR